ncbi:MAG: hypothetical protein HQK65_12895 [Desulfamplus sp.]|nr:hypothetical protein [Desulfamplus sp.]
MYKSEKKISAGAPKGNQNALKEEKKQCTQNGQIVSGQHPTHAWRKLAFEFATVASLRTPHARVEKTGLGQILS